MLSYFAARALCHQQDVFLASWVLSFADLFLHSHLFRLLATSASHYTAVICRVLWGSPSHSSSEQVIGVNKVYDCEIVFALKQTCATSNNLFEFNHAVYRAQQNNVAYIACVNACGELLASSQDCGIAFSLSLKLVEIGIPNLTVVGSDTHTVVIRWAVCFLIIQSRTIAACAWFAQNTMVFSFGLMRQAYPALACVLALQSQSSC